MIPVRLEVKNFLAYRSPDPIHFDGVHLACLTGPNGAGKSSLLDAITWVLWGRARGKRDDDLVHIGQSDMHVQLDFEQEGMTYRVLRRRTRRQRGAGALEIFSILGDGELNTLSEPAIRDTQNKINQLLRLDYETFVHSAFLQQGKADAFTTKAAAQRKQILSDILGLEQWTVYEDAAKDILKQITAELSVIEVRVSEIDAELAREPHLQAALAEAEQAQAEAQTALEAAETALAEVAHAPAAMKAAQERQADMERRVREHERDLGTVETDIERQEGRLAAFADTIAHQEDIEAGYAALQSARDIDHDLGDKLLQLRDFDDERRALETQLHDARAELENEVSGYQAQIAELERDQQNANPDDLSAVQAEVHDLKAIEKQRDDLSAAIQDASEEKAGLDGERKTLEVEGRGMRDRLERLQAVNDDTAACPLCGQPLDDEHRHQLIEQLDTEIQERREGYAANQERSKELGAQIKEQRAAVAEMELELKRLPPLLERVGHLQAQLDRAHEAAARRNEVVAQLEAVQTVLENEGYAQDIRQQLAALEQRRAEIGYDADSHSAAREQLSTYQEYDARHKELELAVNAIPDVEAALEAARARRERIITALAEDREVIEGLKTEIAELDVLVKEQQVRQQEVNRQRTIERQQYQRLVNARQELDALDKQRARKADLEARRERKRHDEALYKELRAAFGKNGVPAMIIEAAIPELEASANRLLSRMTDGRMNLNFTTQREKAAGDGVIETLDIQIADELGTRTYEMYSGGEAFRINFAIRVALSQLLARRAGAHLRTLFIDEGFGTQDEDGRNKLVDAITAIQDDFDLILVITHIDELRDSFPVHIIVQKTPTGSRVNVR
ncbi:MAG: SMC family ATPase [Anaerolineaceae bacterium]|nr:SMC family ATPase [Anaerolineaceae bacterium]